MSWGLESSVANLTRHDGKTDHIYGLQAFTDATDAQVVAHENASLYLTSPDAKQRLDQRRRALTPWVNDKTRLIAPDLTFAEELTLESGGYRFSLIHAGPAHARDDILMLVEPPGVLFSGDIIQKWPNSLSQQPGSGHRELA